jgi:hypothetical protein
MKINPVLLLIAFGIAALAAFGIYNGYSGETEYRWIITIGSGLTLFITLGGTLAFSSPHGGTANIKIVSVIFFVAFLLEHLIFVFSGVNFTPYVIITGILLLLYILIAYAITRALK